jgi:serine/threonine protein kinase/tetratricopeptide (TPR) repeat protein
MSAASDQEIDIFTRAAALLVEERDAFLKGACGTNETLRIHLTKLLLAHEDVGNFMARGVEPATRENRVAGEKPGDVVGRYKLLQQIGEGGCGAVFMAEQEAPIRRRVALKIIKPGMDTNSVMARFEAERQALAMMDHPNIAKVFDAGATESGRPYFVMELVRGIKITEYCDQNSLTTEERLKLFVQVCQAIQHAHQKGLIHRDIKPSNILVTQSEQGEALPVVIDFGIAKATTNQRLTDKTFFTAFEVLIGTPAYMSPEQAALTSVDVDTRSDIYSLGVLLYELLIGSPPFRNEELLKIGLDEIRRVIREEEPARPSTKLVKMADRELTTIARNRKAEPPRLIRAISGDLDWIVMKALEKDRTRRYETASGLALDVKRFLANETISARPPGKIYRFRKTVSRNKLLFSATAVIALLLVVSLVIVSAALAKAQRARFEADQALAQARRQKTTAETEMTKSRQVTRFLKDMLQGVGPSVAMGRDTKMLREILDQTAARVGQELTNQPIVEAELRSLVGRLYYQIGYYPPAEGMHRPALALHERLFGPESAEAAGSHRELGLALWKQGKLAEAESEHTEALRIRRKLFVKEHSDVAASLNDLAVVYRHQRKLHESEMLSRESIEMRRKLLGDDDLEVAESLHNLSIVLGDEGRYDESETTAHQVLEIRRRRLGGEHPLVAAAILDLAWATGWTDKVKAEELQREALAMQRKLLGDEHPDVSISLASLGERLRQKGNVSEAHSLLSAALSVQRKVLGETSPAYLFSLASLALTLEQEKKLPEAETAHRQGISLYRTMGVGIENPRMIEEVDGLARTLVAQNKLRDAEQLLEEILKPEFIKQPFSARLLAQRVDLFGRQGRWQEAAVDAALVVQYEPAEHYRYHTLAPLLVITGDTVRYRDLCRKIISRFADTSDAYVAERMTKDCLLTPNPDSDLSKIAALAEKAVTLDDDHNSTGYFQTAKALSEYRQGHFSEAAQWGQKALRSSQDYARAHAYGIVAMALWHLQQPDEARRMLSEGEALASSMLPANGVEKIGPSWVAWLVARICLDEATALIQDNSRPPERTRAEPKVPIEQH